MGREGETAGRGKLPRRGSSLLPLGQMTLLSGYLVKLVINYVHNYLYIYIQRILNK